MSSPARLIRSLQLQTITTYDRRHYTGELIELLAHLEQGKRTGVVIVHLNQGTCQKVEFESRVKEIKKVY